jgi:hypothetical protein
MRILGLKQFAPTGSTDFLLEHFGLTADGIATAARAVLGADDGTANEAEDATDEESADRSNRAS